MNEQLVNEQTNDQQRSRGGRPRNPPAPMTLEDCNRCIATELAKAKSKQDAKRLRQLQGLRKSYEGIEGRREAAEERRVRELQALAEAERNRIEHERLELKRADYQRRFVVGEQTKVENKLRENALLKLQQPFATKLEAYIRKLDDLLRRAKVEIESHEQTIGAQQTEISELRSRVKSLESDSTELHRIENAAKEELAKTGEGVAHLEEELKRLKAQEQTTLVLERKLEVLKMLKVLINRDKSESQE